jgi:hypothetical protein
MNSRREVSQLVAGDRIRTQLTLHWEVSVVGKSDDGNVDLLVWPAPCGPDCGTSCECHSAMFGKAGPFTLTLKGSQRLQLLGNLKQLEADFELVQAQIARLKVGKSGDKPDEIEAWGEALKKASH